MRKWIAIVLMVAILSSLCICAYAEDITGLQEQSNEITQQLNETNNRLKAIQEQLSEQMQQLQDIDNQLAQSQEDLNKINIEVEDLMKQIEENEEKLAKTQKEYDDIQGLLDARLISMYETPELQFLEVILSSKSASEFLANYYAMKELAEYDTELLETVKQQKQDIETTKKILAEKKQQAITSKQNQQKKTQVFENTKTMRQYYISKLSAQEQELQAQIDEYNAQVSEIETEIKMLALNSISEDYIGGAMTWPVPRIYRVNIIIWNESTSNNRGI